jgi:hypothetical protein
MKLLIFAFSVSIAAYEKAQFKTYPSVSVSLVDCCINIMQDHAAQVQ